MMVRKWEPTAITHFEPHLALNAGHSSIFPRFCQHGFRQVDADDLKLRQSTCEFDWNLAGSSANVEYHTGAHAQGECVIDERIV